MTSSPELTIRKTKQNTKKTQLNHKHRTQIATAKVRPPWTWGWADAVHFTTVELFPARSRSPTLSTTWGRGQSGLRTGSSAASVSLPKAGICSARGKHSSCWKRSWRGPQHLRGNNQSSNPPYAISRRTLGQGKVTLYFYRSLCANCYWKFCCCPPRKHGTAQTLTDHKRTPWCHLSSRFIYFKELLPSL